MVLTRVTRHKIHTIGKLGQRYHYGIEKSAIQFVVKDNFPIDYEGILGIDFLQKQQAMCDLGKRRLCIGDEILKLQPYSKLILKPRSETVIQAITSSKRVGIVKTEETMPGIH